MRINSKLIQLSENKLLLTMAVVILLLLPRVNFGQIPNLGTATNYALFTSNGAFSNVGATYIAGNISTNMGALTGFPPGKVIGQTHVADSISVQVAIDVNSAYSYLGGMTCDTTIGDSLGNNQVLSPKIYCVLTAATLNGDLILDGQGDPKALFIFKIDGALSTGSFSNIILIDSASLRNVYWQINGAFTLGDSSIFKGTAIVNGVINLLENASLLGRGLSKAGAIYLHNNVVDTIATRTDNVNPLPIELLSFTADCNNQNVVLTWSTATETNNDYYSIESSIDGANWQIIGKVNGADNSTTIRNYSFTDKEPNNTISYYRLKQTDFNGNFKYFTIIAVKNCMVDSIEIAVHPNPASGEFNLLFKGDKDQINSLSIYDILGKKVYDSNIFQSIIDLSDKQDGIYFLYCNLTSKTIIKKLVIQK